MIRYSTSPLHRERILLAAAVLVVLTGYFLALTSFAGSETPATVTLAIGALRYTFRRALWDSMLAVIFAAAVYGTYLSVNRKRRSDFIVFPVVTVLTGLGLIHLLRLSYDADKMRLPDTISALPYRQTLWIMIGLGVFSLTVRLTSSRVIHRMSRLRYFYVTLAMILIALTFVFGETDADRTLSIKITDDLLIMPVEFVKILVILFGASYFGRRGAVNPHGSSRVNATPYLVMIVLLLSLLVIQRDTGPLIIMWCALATMYGTATGRWFRVVAAGLITVLLGVLAYMLNTPSIVRTRFDMWLNPFALNEQVVRGFWSQASGGLAGTGFGRGIAFRIPEVQSDFNYVVIAEELGYIGAAMTIVLFAVLALAGLNIAIRSADPFRRLLAAGISSMIFFQMVVIVGGNTGLLPLTGITLPFVSAGGSSMISAFFIIGLLYRISCADMERMS
jgi:cell division protein FtsW (lipid II flippase)